MRWNAKGAALLVLMVVSGQGCQPAQPQHATLIEAVECGDRLDARRPVQGGAGRGERSGLVRRSRGAPRGYRRR